MFKVDFNERLSSSGLLYVYFLFLFSGGSERNEKVGYFEHLGLLIKRRNEEIW